MSSSCMFMWTILFYSFCLISAEEIFTNPYVLQQLYEMEIDVIDILNVTEFAKDPQYQSYSTMMQNAVAELKNGDIQDVLVPNPIHNFHLMRRMSMHWQSLLDSVMKFIGQDKKHAPWLSIRAKLTSMVNNMSPELFPTHQDVIGSAMGLARIQYVYQLPMIDFVQGILRDRKTTAKINAEDCYFIGMDRVNGRPIAFDREELEVPQDYAIAVEWLEIALWQALREQNNSLLNKIEEDLRYVRHLHDLHFLGMDHNPHMDGPDGQSEYPNEAFFIERINSLENGKRVPPRSSIELRSREKEVLASKYSYSVEDTAGNPWFYFSDYHKLCRGESLKRLDEDKVDANSQRCYYVHHNDPYLFIQPVKVEVLSENPVLWIFHDVVSENGIEKMKNMAYDKLNTAGTVQYTFNEETNSFVEAEDIEELSVYRTAATGWLFDQDDPYLHALSKKVGRYTNLNVARPDDRLHNEGIYESEGFQVGVYAPGGHYNPHDDALMTVQDYPTDEGFVGNRIATFMFYLSEVDGGATSFPNIGAAAFPKKGSAAFWYLLNAKGSMVETMVYHGGCPAIFGVKWVANLWIHEGPQIFKRPCHIDQDRMILHDEIQS